MFLLEVLSFLQVEHLQSLPFPSHCNICLSQIVHILETFVHVILFSGKLLVQIVGCHGLVFGDFCTHATLFCELFHGSFLLVFFDSFFVLCNLGLLFRQLFDDLILTS